MRGLADPGRSAYILRMRPAILDPLFAPASALPGVGPKNAKLFDKLLDRPHGARVLDLLFHLPIAAIDRRARPKIRDARRDAIATLEVRVAEHRPPASNRKGPFKVLVEDDTGDVELVFFLANIEWIKKRLPLGATRWVSGKLGCGTAICRWCIPTASWTNSSSRRCRRSSRSMA